MKKIVRLSESDLVKIVKRVIQEGNYGGDVPCIDYEFKMGVMKIPDSSVVQNIKQKIGVGAKLGDKKLISGYLLYDSSNISLPDKKYGSIKIYYQNRQITYINLDGKQIGDDFYTYSEIGCVPQESDILKLGWVICPDGQGYVFDMIGEGKNVIDSGGGWLPKIK
jgi:hypothetical protein